MYKCPYCSKEYENRQSYAAHISMCKYNPNTHRRGMNIDVSKEKKDIRKEYICTCQKCGKEYTVVVTPRQFETGRYRKYCSLSCANSHIKTKEERNKIANSLKNSDKFYSSLLTRKPPITGAERKPYSGRKTYKCKQCGKEFITNTIIRKGRHIHCPDCKQDREHVKQDPQSLMDLSSRTVSKILQRAKCSCSICGWNESTCDIHHIVPRSEGGSNSSDNLIIVCPNCHRVIHTTDKYTKEFLQNLAVDKTFTNWKEFYHTKN